MIFDGSLSLSKPSGAHNQFPGIFPVLIDFQNWGKHDYCWLLSHLEQTMKRTCILMLCWWFGCRLHPQQHWCFDRKCQTCFVIGSECTSTYNKICCFVNMKDYQNHCYSLVLWCCFLVDSFHYRSPAEARPGGVWNRQVYALHIYIYIYTGIDSTHSYR